MKLIIVITFISLMLVCGILFLLFGTGLHHLLYDDACELGFRAACMAKQKTIYLALKTYYSDYNELPPNLMILAQQNYIEGRELYCPEPPEKADIRFYQYYPDNWGNPDMPLISENIDNHAGKRLRLRNIKPVIIQTMGDGTIGRRDVSNKK